MSQRSAVARSAETNPATGMRTFLGCKASLVSIPGRRADDGLLAQAVLPHLRVQQASIDAQLLRGAGPIASGAFERVEDQPPLERRHALLEWPAWLSVVCSDAVAVWSSCVPAGFHGLQAPDLFLGG